MIRFDVETAGGISNLKKLNAAYTKIEAGVNKTTTAYDKQTARLGKNLLISQELEKHNKTLFSENEKLASSVRALMVAYSDQEQALEKLASTTGAVTRKLSKLTAGIEGQFAALEKVEVKIRSTFAATAELARGMGGETAALVKLNTELAATDAATGVLNSAYSKQISLEAELIVMRDGSISAINKKNNKLLKEISLEKESIELGTLTVAQLKKKVRARERAVIMLNKTYIATQRVLVENEKLAVSEKLLEVEANRVAAATNRVAAATNRAAVSNRTARSAFRGTAGALGGLWLAYGDILPMMTAFAVIASARDAVKLGADFEYSTKYAYTLAKASGDVSVSLEDMRKKLLSFTDLRTGPAELAEGMKEFVKAGTNAASALRDIAEVSKLAKLSGMDLNTTLKLVIGQANAFGETYSDTANMIFAASSSSATGVKELATAMSQTTELGLISGLTFKEVAAGIAILGKNAIIGGKAGTSFRTSIVRLMTPSEKFKKILADINSRFPKLHKSFSAFHDDGSMKNYIELFKSLANTLKGLTTEDQAKLIREALGMRAMKGGVAQVREVNTGLQKMVDYIGKSTKGMTLLSKATGEMADTAAASFDKMVAHWDRFLISLKGSDIASFVVTTVDNSISLADAIVHPLDTISLAFKKTKRLLSTGLLLPEEAKRSGNLIASISHLYDLQAKAVEDLAKAKKNAVDPMAVGFEMTAPYVARLKKINGLLKEYQNLAYGVQKTPMTAGVLNYTVDNESIADVVSKSGEVSSEILAIRKEATDKWTTYNKKALSENLDALASKYQAEKKIVGDTGKDYELLTKVYQEERVKLLDIQKENIKKQEDAEDKHLDNALKKVKDRVEKEVKLEKKLNEEKLKVANDLKDRILQISESEFDYERDLRNKKLDLLAAQYEDDSSIQDLITDYRQKSLEKQYEDQVKNSFIMQESTDMLGDYLIEKIGGYDDAWGKLWDDMLKKVVEKVAEMAAEMATTEFLSWFSTDSKESKKSKSSWDWSEFFANGGSVNDGGVLQGGSGVRDDLYLGMVGGKKIVAKSGEYIMPPQQTTDNRGMLDAMREGKVKAYAVGGMLGNPTIAEKLSMAGGGAAGNSGGIILPKNSSPYVFSPNGDDNIDENTEQTKNLTEKTHTLTDTNDNLNDSSKKNTEGLNTATTSFGKFAHEVATAVYGLKDDMAAIGHAAKVGAAFGAVKGVSYGPGGVIAGGIIGGLGGGIKQAVKEAYHNFNNPELGEANTDTSGSPTNGTSYGNDPGGEFGGSPTGGGNSDTGGPGYGSDPGDDDAIGFATGGFHRGGWRVVGEKGPELEYTLPSKIFNNEDSKKLLKQNITIPVVLQMGTEKITQFVVKVADNVATVRQEQGVIGRAYI